MTDGVRTDGVRTVGIRWQEAELVAVRPETATISSFRFALTHPVRHLPGQHYILRLTAPDGYSASRSYSVASAPDDSGEIELAIEALPDGEVSGFMHDEARPGDRFELRGPIGGFFVWTAQRPALLVGGGSGVVPLVSMLRHARAVGGEDLLQLVVSVRTEADLPYAEELLGPRTTLVTTRVAAAGSPRPAGRVALGDLPAITADTDVYVCGSNGFADAVTGLLLSSGVTTAEHIKVERFGATG